jgi:hypothetical protein
MTPARRTLPAPTEAVEQRILAQYLDVRGFCWAHPPMGGQRNRIVAAKLKAQGAKAGLVDVLIFDHPPKMHGVVGAAIELKRKGSPPSAVSPEQRAWLEALSKRGWKTAVCRGADEAIQFLEALYGC